MGKVQKPIYIHATWAIENGMFVIKDGFGQHRTLKTKNKVYII